MKLLITAIGACALLLAAPAHAAIIYTVSLNTSPLVGHGSFTLDFQFLDGSGSPGDLNNNTVTLQNFTFGVGGAPSGGGFAIGGAAGSLAAGVTLTDASFFNEYIEDFIPGTLLSFTIQTTNAMDPGGTPDLFTLAILDALGHELPTTGPASEFLDISLEGGAAPVVSAFGSAPGSAFELQASVAPAQDPAAVPEPSTALLLASAVMLLALGRMRRGMLPR